MSRHEMPKRILQELNIPGPISLSGPSGSGKSHTLSELSELLTASNAEHALIHHGDKEALEKLTSLPRHGIFLLDGIEQASPELIQAMVLRSQASAGICTMRNDRENRHYNATLHRIVDDHPHTAAVVAGMRHFQIAPLTPREAMQIAVQSGQTLDSVTLLAVIHLAWGRPGWMRDLLQIAAAGKIGADPHPTIFALDTSDCMLPVVRELLDTAHTSLTEEARAAAVTLAQLEPRSLGGTVDLFDEALTRQLRHTGVLIEAPEDSRMFGVPEIYGAALAAQVDTTLLQRSNVLAATRLLEQEALGIPLPASEAAFCARVLRRRGSGARSRNTAGAADAADAQSLDLTHTRLVNRLAASLVSFGRPEARDLLLRVRSFDGLGALPRLQAVGSLSGPAEALRAMRAPVFPPAPTSESAPSKAGTFTDDLWSVSRDEQYGIEFLRQIFLAEMNPLTAGTVASVATVATVASGELASDEFAQAEFLFRRWNDTASISDDAPLLLQIAQHHSVSEVALFAEQLLALENAKLGRTMRIFPDSSEERSLRIASLALTGPDGLNDLLTATAVTAGLVSLLSATNLTGADALTRAVAHLPGSAYHALWISHLFSAVTAAASGNVDHSVLEWALFEERVPRFLPVRLRKSIETIGAAFRGEHSGSTVEHEPCHQLLPYFKGAFEQVDLRPSTREDGLARATQAVPLDIVRIAAAHIDAVKTENPAQLMRVADELISRELWAPAAYALQEARTIFLRRRASGGVARCDEQLRTLEQTARAKIGRFSLGRLDSTPRISLTPRQLDTARLAATGLRNTDIAEQIHCSVRTVESHLSAARAKLGALNRADIARAMREHGLL